MRVELGHRVEENGESCKAAPPIPKKPAHKPEAMTNRRVSMDDATYEMARDMAAALEISTSQFIRGLIRGANKTGVW